MSAPSSYTPRVSVVVPTRGRKELLTKCLQSLLKQGYPRESYEIIVVEDGTSEGRPAVDSFAEENSPIRYFRISHSGPATAYNEGLKQARHEIVAFIDDDAVASQNWLQELAAALVEGRDEKVAGVGGRISADYPTEELHAHLSEDGELIWGGFNVLLAKPQDVDFLPGANMAFWRNNLLEIGGFDCNFSRTISWRHETDVGLRLRGRGFRLRYDPNLVVFHCSARWKDVLERVRPSVVWCMIRDDAYFRTKNFGLRGARAAIVSSARGARLRLILSAITFFLVFVHLIAWIPGMICGSRVRTGKTASPEGR